MAVMRRSASPGRADPHLSIAPHRAGRNPAGASAVLTVMQNHPHQAAFERLDRLSRQLDTAFRIPGTGFRLGYDAIASLLPVIGDLAAALPAAWIILESHRMGLPRAKLARQGLNLALDSVIGSIPILGTIFDAVWRANRRNVEILRAHLQAEADLLAEAPRRAPATPPAIANETRNEARPAVLKGPLKDPLKDP